MGWLRIFLKRQVKSEIDIYRREEILNVDTYVNDYRKSRQDEIQNLARACSKDTAEYEHRFHSAMEEKKVVLAILDAKIDAKRELLMELDESHKTLINIKDKEIQRLNASLVELIKGVKND